MKKRIFTMALALCMILSLLPIGAAAAEIVGSGTCGENVTWTLDSEGTLTISGTGPMADYNRSEDVPWDMNAIRSVVVNEGVTRVGGNAFAAAYELSSVTLPDTIETLGESSISWCPKLTQLTIPASVKCIEEFALAGNAFTEITIPDSVTEIGDQAFYSCESLKSAVIGNGVVKYGNGVFADCFALERAAFNDGAKVVGQSMFSYCVSLTEVQMPASIERIEGSAFFSCYSLKEIELPSGLKEIDRAFKFCEHIETLRLAEGNTAFCLVDGVLFTRDMKKLIYCPAMKTGTFRIPEGVEEIDPLAFNYSCLSEISIPDTVVLIGDNAFSYTRGLTRIALPERLETVQEDTFNGHQTLGCTLQSVYVPVSVTSIAGWALGADTLTDVYYSGTQEQWDAIAIEKGNEYDTALENATIHCNHVHTWDEGKVLTPATQDAEGTELYTCTVCGKTETRPIEKLPPVSGPFEDVAADQYYAEPVSWAVEQGITKGTGETTFSPDMTCTRGQIVTFLWRAKGSPEPTSDVNPFSDVSNDAYYCKAVLWAVENGITQGTGNGLFSPDAACTRGQVVTFLFRAEGEPEASGSNSFRDVPEDAFYARPVLWAVEKNITQGTGNGLFSPDTDCTRGQIVTFLYRDMK